jgi:hypothetical protein
MTVITINSVVPCGSYFTVNGAGDPNRNFVVCVSGTGQQLSQGCTDHNGNFSINVTPGSNHEYDIVLRHLEQDGTIGDNRSWSTSFRNPVK